MVALDKSDTNGATANDDAAEATRMLDVLVASYYCCGLQNFQSHTLLHHTPIPCTSSLPIHSNHGHTKQTRLDHLAAHTHQDRRGSNVSAENELTNLFITHPDPLTTSSTQKNPDDVVITLAIRTPLTKGNKGGFKDTDLDYIVYSLLKEVNKRSSLDPNLVEDICLGNVLHLLPHSLLC